MKSEKTNKVLAVADVHGKWEDIPVDGHGLVLIAGDIRPGTMRKEDRVKYAGWVNVFFAWMARFPETDFVVVPGNHDFELAVELLPSVKRECPANVHLLADEEWTWNGLRIYGFPWNTPYNKGVNTKMSDMLGFEAWKIPTGLDILVSHTPPYVEENGFVTENCSKELTMAIEDRKPRLVICGHEHRLSHEPFQLGESSVVLVSMKLHKDDGEFTYQSYEFDV